MSDEVNVCNNLVEGKKLDIGFKSMSFINSIDKNSIYSNRSKEISKSVINNPNPNYDSDKDFIKFNIIKTKQKEKYDDNNLNLCANLIIKWKI